MITLNKYSDKSELNSEFPVSRHLQGAATPSGQVGDPAQTDWNDSSKKARLCRRELLQHHWSNKGKMTVSRSVASI